MGNCEATEMVSFSSKQQQQLKVRDQAEALGTRFDVSYKCDTLEIFYFPVNYKNVVQVLLSVNPGSPSSIFEIQHASSPVEVWCVQVNEEPVVLAE
jgi:hypothetical protein